MLENLSLFDLRRILCAMSVIQSMANDLPDKKTLDAAIEEINQKIGNPLEKLLGKSTQQDKTLDSNSAILDKYEQQLMTAEPEKKPKKRGRAAK
ncbi:MAG: hypothetical protein AB1847_21120 [bacterium]